MYTFKKSLKTNTIKVFSYPLFDVDLSISKGGVLILNSLNLNPNDAAQKVDPEMLVKFINDICMHLNKQNATTNKKFMPLKRDFNINLHHHYFCAETIRDIYSNIISNLLNDDSIPSSNNVVSFGYLARKVDGTDTKPQRLEYVDMCNIFPELTYISTKNYNIYDLDCGDFTSILDLKKQFKYFIDLKGHSYSTKTYQLLASRRVYFSSQHNSTLNWEKQHLKPWRNFIPVKEDLSDLTSQYQIIESDPALYQQIVENNLNLLNNELSPNAMLKQLLNEISNCVSTKPQGDSKLK